MPKNILIFSDGTGQIGGLKPDQRLSNVYKMYRAMRPGPSSPIKPSEQVAYYDPGLGAGEVETMSLRRVRNMLEAAVGTGIDDNVIDCYEKIISYYEPGDKILLFGFSRGAYTVRSLANVMNLCGVPTRMPDGSPVPRYGPKLREIASHAVKSVYNHGAGKPRGLEPHLTQREEMGRRFRVKYGSSPVEGPDVEGNVQPTFIGVFDTVAALGDRLVSWVVYCVMTLVFLGLLSSLWFGWSTWMQVAFTGAFLGIAGWYATVLKSQFKYFSPDETRPLRLANPLHWPSIYKHGHMAWWNRKNYDRWLDSGVRFARHALAIDEHRHDFPRVHWASTSEEKKMEGKQPEWLKQVWFAGCHSDIGGSYPEPESRLSDIALNWMVEELKECVPDTKICEDNLVRSPDPLGLQHEETFMFDSGLPGIKKKWKFGPRIVEDQFELHQSVVARLQATAVPQVGEMKPYRPPQLSTHRTASGYYSESVSNDATPAR